MFSYFIKQNTSKQEEDAITIYKKKNPPITPKEVENVLDLEFVGVEKDYPDQKSALPIKKNFCNRFNFNIIKNRLLNGYDVHIITIQL